MGRSLVVLWIKIGLLLALVLTPATFVLPWIQISDTHYNGIKICRNGMSYGVALEGDPNDDSPIEVPIVGTVLGSGEEVLDETLVVYPTPIAELPGVTHSAFFTSFWSTALLPGSKVKVGLDDKDALMPLVTVEDCTLDDSVPAERYLYRNETEMPVPPERRFCRTPALPIPDENPVGVSDSLLLSNSGTLAGLTVYINATHTWVGDLRFTLEHDGSTAALIDRPGVPASGVGCSGNDIDATLYDGASEPVEGVCEGTVPTIQGAFLPNEPLHLFHGASLAGEWTLTVADHEGQDIGALNEWCIEALLDPPSSDNATTTSTITITDTYSIGDLNVMLYMDHAASDEVEATLISPWGTEVTLLAGVGGVDSSFGSSCGFGDEGVLSYFPSGLAPNFVLDDESSFTLTAPSATAPYTGMAFMPLGPGALSDFDGAGVSGTWTLQLHDSNPDANDGVLHCWSLDITEASTAPALYLPLIRRAQ